MCDVMHTLQAEAALYSKLKWIFLVTIHRAFVIISITLKTHVKAEGLVVLSVCEYNQSHVTGVITDWYKSNFSQETVLKPFQYF